MSSQPTSEPDIELPPPSYWPMVLAFGLLLISIGVVSTLLISFVGIIVLLVAIAGWVRENRMISHHHEEA